jgi:hypothetical protein
MIFVNSFDIRFIFNAELAGGMVPDHFHLKPETSTCPVGMILGDPSFPDLYHQR